MLPNARGELVYDIGILQKVIAFSVSFSCSRITMESSSFTSQFESSLDEKL
jgi:hypothetical protein